MCCHLSSIPGSRPSIQGSNLGLERPLGGLRGGSLHYEYGTVFWLQYRYQRNSTKVAQVPISAN